MIRIHDRYVLKAFWATFGAVLLFFTVLTVVLDLSDRISRVSRNWDTIEAWGYEPGQLLLQYYLTLIPFFWVGLIPLCCPSAAVFALSRLNRHNELTPLVTAGVSLRRVTLPIVLSSVVVAALMLGFREQVVPRISRSQMRVERVLSRSSPDRVRRVPHFHDEGGARMSADAFDPIGKKLEGVWLTFRDDKGRSTESYWYPELEWNDAPAHWTAPRGGQHHVPIAGEPGMRRSEIDPGGIAPLQARLLLVEINTMQAETSQRLSFTESRELLRANPTNARFVMLHQGLWTTPLSCIILVLLVLPLSVHVGRKSAIPGMMLATVMMIGFYASGFILGGIGGAGELNPVVLAWLPTAVFGSLGLAMYVGMDG